MDTINNLKGSLIFQLNEVVSISQISYDKSFNRIHDTWENSNKYCKDLVIYIDSLKFITEPYKTQDGQNLKKKKEDIKLNTFLMEDCSEQIREILLKVMEIKSLIGLHHFLWESNISKIRETESEISNLLPKR